MVSMAEYCRREPLKSACWIYVLLTLVPGLFFPGETQYLAESVFRYLLPGALACFAAVRFYQADFRRSFGIKGLGKSLLYGAPVGLLCGINLAVAGYRGCTPGQFVWICGTALGEELMGRMMLFHGVLLGVGRDRLGSPILLSAVIFGLMHAVNMGVLGFRGAIFQILYTAVIGTLFAWSYQKTGCLWGSIVWHTLLNLTGMV